MRSGRRFLALFVFFQVAGIASSWLCWRAPSGIGVPLWIAGFLLLLPGNYLGSWISTALLWRGGLSLISLGAVSTLLALGINAIVWFISAEGVCAIVDRIRRRNHIAN